MRKHLATTRPLLLCAMFLGVLAASACSDDPPTPGSTDSSQAAIADANNTDDAAIANDATSTDPDATANNPACGADNALCCTTNAQCQTASANKCEGSRYCDKSSLPWMCRPVPGSAVTCPVGNDTQCTRHQCDPETGECANIAFNNGGACQDDDLCSVGDKCEAGKCVSGKTSQCPCKQLADCQKFEDGNSCNGTLYCDKTYFPYRCELNKSTVKFCKPSDNPCALNTCNAMTGACELKNAPDHTPCDDGDKQTKGDQCTAGKCAGIPLDQCTVAADCAIIDDGDLCNGTLFCDHSEAVGKCKVNPASIVQCASSGDTACAATKCVNIYIDGKAQNYKCALTPVNEGKPCDDENACTQGDICKVGKCQAGEDVCACGDVKDPKTGKITTKTCEKAEDGDLCNGTLFCNVAKKRCELNPSTVVTCPTVDNNACSKNKCVPKTGKCAMTPEPDKSPCDDGDKCTATEHCVGGKCQKGKVDVCACQANADCAQQDDGNLCNGAPYCDVSLKVPQCKHHTKLVIQCPKTNDSACVKNQCVPKTGKCAFGKVPDAVPCNDGKACTDHTVCLGGECKGGVSVCDCEVDADCADNDDDKCNGTFVCVVGKDLKRKCVFDKSTKVVCNATEPCRTQQCQKETGKCVWEDKDDNTKCLTDNKCFINNVCKAGDCTGAVKVCDDGNPCTDDQCDAKLGCVFKPKNCGNANDCTLTTCDKKTGKCAQDDTANNGKICNADNNGCTLNDTCKNGVCSSGPKPKCNNAKEVCEADECATVGLNGYKCVVVAVPDGTGCDDGNSCKAGAKCEGGKCAVGQVEKLFASKLAPLPVAVTVDAQGKTTSYTINQAAGTVVAAVGEDLIVAGRRNEAGKTPDGKPFENEGLWVARFGAGGNVKWSSFVPGSKLVKEGHHVATAKAIAIVGSKAHILTSTGRQVGLAKIALKDGTWGADDTVAAGGAGKDMQAAARHPDGSWTIAGEASQTSSNPPGTPIQVLTLSSGGNLTKHDPWGGKWKSISNTAYPRGVVAQADGSALIVGYAHCNHCYGAKEPEFKPWASVRYPAVWRTTTTGAVSWIKRPMSHDEGVFHAGVDVAGGGFAVAGHTFSGKLGTTPDKPLLARLDANANLLWKRELPVATGLLDLLPTATGWVGIGWNKPNIHTHAGWVVGLSHSGLIQWQRLLDGSQQSVAVAGANVGDGTIAVVGTELTGVPGDLNKTSTSLCGKVKCDAFVLRLGAFGHDSCDLAGGCGGKKSSDCDDNNPCTIDSCNPKNGSCQHSAADGQACVDGNPCVTVASCKGDKCISEANGRVFERVFSATQLPVGELGGMREQADGSLLTAMSYNKKLYLRTVSATGELGSAVEVAATSKKLPSGDYEVIRKAWLGGERNVIVTGHKNGQRIVALVDQTGKRIAESTDQTVIQKYNVAGIVHPKPGEHAIVLLVQLGAFGTTKVMRLNAIDVFPKKGTIEAKDKVVSSNGAPGQGPYVGVLRSDGRVLIFSSNRDGNSKDNGIMYLASSDMKAVTVEDSDRKGSKHRLVQAQSLGDKSIATIGNWIGSGTKVSRSILTLMTETNKITWQAQIGDKTRDTLAGGLLHRDNGLTAATFAKVTADKKALLSHHSKADGKVLWTRTFAMENHDIELPPNSLLALGNGRIAMWGDVVLHSGSKRGLWLTDPWGNKDCKLSGGCFPKPAGTCSDCNAATANACK